MGCVAYIAFDDLAVNVRNLYCEPENGKWSISVDYPVEQLSAAVDKHRIVHLSWNPPGSDLAVVDIYGRIFIFTLTIAMNRITMTRRPPVDSEDDLNALVGLTWLKPKDLVVSCEFGRGMLLN